MGLEINKDFIRNLKIENKNDEQKKSNSEDKENEKTESTASLQIPTVESEKQMISLMNRIGMENQIKFISKTSKTDIDFLPDGVSKFKINNDDVTIFKRGEQIKSQIISEKSVIIDNIYKEIKRFKPIIIDNTDNNSDNGADTDTDTSTIGVNGELDEYIIQGSTGDCWLLSGVLALNSTEEGKQIIKDSIKVNSDSSVTVTFKGANASYTITAAEIKKYDTDKRKNDSYSNGDNDMLVLELAIEKLKKDIKSGKVRLDVPEDSYESMDKDSSLDGGFPQQMIYLMTGKVSDTHCVDTDSVPARQARRALAEGLPIEEVYEVLENAANNEPSVLTFGVYYGVKSAKCTDGKTCTIDVREGGHALAITNVDANNKTVTVVNPWDTTSSYTMSWEEFAGMGIGMLTSTQLDKVEEPTPEEPVTPADSEDEPVTPEGPDEDPVTPDVPEDEPVIPVEPVVPNNDVDISGLEKWADEIDFTVLPNLNDKINIRNFDSQECFESFELIREQIVEYIKNKLDAMGLKHNDETINKVLNRIFSQNCVLYLFKENSLKAMLERIMSKVDEAISNSRNVLFTTNTTKIYFVNVALERYVDNDLVNTNGFYLTEEEKELKDIMLRVYGNDITSNHINYNNGEEKELSINEAIHEMDIFSVHLRKYFKQIGLMGNKLSDSDIEEILKDTKTNVLNTFYLDKNKVSEKSIIMHFVVWANSSAQAKLGYKDSIRQVAPDEPVIPDEPVVSNNDVDISGLEKWADEIDFSQIPGLNEQIKKVSDRFDEIFAAIDTVREQLVDYVKSHLSELGVEADDEYINKVLNCIITLNTNISISHPETNTLKRMMQNIMSDIDSAIKNSTWIYKKSSIRELNHISFRYNQLYPEANPLLMETSDYYLSDEERELREIMQRVSTLERIKNATHYHSEKDNIPVLIDTEVAKHEVELMAGHFIKYLEQEGFSKEEAEAAVSVAKQNIIDNIKDYIVKGIVINDKAYGEVDESKFIKAFIHYVMETSGLSKPVDYKLI